MQGTEAIDPGVTKFSSYQKLVIAVLAFLQFTVILDFMILSPLGAILMPALSISPAQFGFVVSIYAFSAGISGIAAAGFADRYDRKKLLAIFYGGFLAGTLLCGLASSYELLVLARMVTGVFAGIVGSTVFAITTDLFDFRIRGRVMGILQTAFAASNVVGLPLALFLAKNGNWNAPFLLIAGIGLFVGVVILKFLRPIDEHLRSGPDRSPLHHFLHTVRTTRYLRGFAATALLATGGFILMPYMSAFIVHNLGIPFEHLPMIYLATGFSSIVAGPMIGRAADAFGKFVVFCFGCAATIAMVVIYTNLGVTPLALVIVINCLLFVGVMSRMISASALISAIPAPPDRGAYMSISSSIQQISGGLAAIVGGVIVAVNDDGSLRHFDTVGYVLVCTTLITLLMMYFISRTVEPKPAIA